MLAALARALDLDTTERSHLFTLAGYREAHPILETAVTPAVRALLDQLEPNPAYLLNRVWDAVAWNKAEEWLSPDMRLPLDHHRLAVLDQPGLQLVIYTPIPKPNEHRDKVRAGRIGLAYRRRPRSRTGA